MNSQKIKLMIVTSSLNIGGAEMVIYNLCKYLKNNNIDVCVCHLKESGHVGDMIRGLGVEMVGLKKGKSTVGRYLSFLALRKIIVERNINILHSHTTYSFADATACKITKPKLKLVHTFHFGNYPNYNKKYMALEKLCSKVATKLVGVGEEQIKTLKKIYGNNSSKFIKIWNGVERQSAKIDKNSMQGVKGKLVIGTICTFIEQKGLYDLLKVVKILSKIRNDFIFVICGDGPLRKSIEKTIVELEIKEFVVLTGWKENAAETVMPIFDIFFQPSLWEAMSMVVLEAMAQQKALVVTNVGDNRHVIESDRTGCIVESGDTENMAAKLMELLDNKEKRAKMGRYAYEHYQKYFTIEKMGESHVKLYGSIV